VAQKKFEDLEPGTYDRILANIDGRTLPSLCPYLQRLLDKQGIACLSGLQFQDLSEISRALEKSGLKIIAHHQKGKWLALEITSSLNVKC